MVKFSQPNEAADVPAASAAHHQAECSELSWLGGETTSSDRKGVPGSYLSEFAVDDTSASTSKKISIRRRYEDPAERTQVAERRVKGACARHNKSRKKVCSYLT
jgi:hypothetical protein